jgi:RimJ/RimL family protein N-acetyltransferase
MHSLHQPPTPFAHTLQTARVLLQAPRMQDAAALTEAVCESLPALRAWPTALPWAQEVPTRAASEAWVRSSRSEWQRGTALGFLVWEAGTQLVGGVGLHALDWQARQGEIGFWCRSSRAGQGLMHAATAELLRYALKDLGLQRVEALTDAANLRSRALCERLGLQLLREIAQAEAAPAQGPGRTCVYATTEACSGAGPRALERHVGV